MSNNIESKVYKLKIAFIIILMIIMINVKKNEKKKKNVIIKISYIDYNFV